jgi:hypothetical protein
MKNTFGSKLPKANPNKPNVKPPESKVPSDNIPDPVSIQLDSTISDSGSEVNSRTLTEVLADIDRKHDFKPTFVTPETPERPMRNVRVPERSSNKQKVKSPETLKVEFLQNRSLQHDVDIAKLTDKVDGLDGKLDKIGSSLDRYFGIDDAKAGGGPSPKISKNIDPNIDKFPNNSSQSNPTASNKKAAVTRPMRVGDVNKESVYPDIDIPMLKVLGLHPFYLLEPNGPEYDPNCHSVFVLQTMQKSCQQRNEKFDMENPDAEIENDADEDDFIAHRSLQSVGVFDDKQFGTPLHVQAPIDYGAWQFKARTFNQLFTFIERKHELRHKYPTSRLNIRLLVAAEIRQDVIGNWNLAKLSYDSELYPKRKTKQFKLNEWFILSDDITHSMLVEYCRPTSNNKFQQGVLQFCSYNIPQGNVVNVENFAKEYALHLTNSLSKLEFIYQNFYRDISGIYFDDRKDSYGARCLEIIPPEGFGTKDNRGLLYLWFQATGKHNQALLGLCEGFDIMKKFKKFSDGIRHINRCFMELTVQSHAYTRTIDKMSPIVTFQPKFNYDAKDSSNVYKSPSPAASNYNSSARTGFKPGFLLNKSNSSEAHGAKKLSNLDAIDQYDDDDADFNRQVGFRVPSVEFVPEFEIDCDHDLEYDTERIVMTPMPEQDASYGNEYIAMLNTEYASELAKVPALNAVIAGLQSNHSASPRESSMASIFRGYCAKKFITGRCGDDGCKFSHDAAGQELCIQSFYLLSKRQLDEHKKLPFAAMVRTGAGPPKK